MVLQGAADDLRSRGGVGVHQHRHRNGRGDRVSGRVDRLRRLRATARGDDHAVGDEHAGHQLRLGDQAAAVVAQVEHDRLDAARQQRLERLRHLPVNALDVERRQVQDPDAHPVVAGDGVDDDRCADHLALDRDVQLAAAAFEAERDAGTGAAANQVGRGAAAEARQRMSVDRDDHIARPDPGTRGREPGNDVLDDQAGAGPGDVDPDTRELIGLGVVERVVRGRAVVARIGILQRGNGTGDRAVDQAGARDRVVVVVLDVAERLVDHLVLGVRDERVAQEARQVAGMSAPPDAEDEDDEYAQRGDRPCRLHRLAVQPSGRPSVSRHYAPPTAARGADALGFADAPDHD